MNDSRRIPRLMGLALICILMILIVVLTACGESEITDPPITTDAIDPGFSIPETDSIRVVTGMDGSVISLYVDEENKTLDLNQLASAQKSFTVTDADGKLVNENIIKINATGDFFTIFYGDDKTPYRLIVYFNVYCNVTFEGIETPIRVLKGEFIKLPDTKPTKTGYTFDGWDIDPNEAITSDMTVLAKWKASTYTITFDAKGGTLALKTMTATYGESVNLPVPVMSGYVFVGWHDGSAVVNSGVWTIAKDVTLSAMWDHHDYKITYDPNGGEVDKTLQGVSYGASFTPPIPKRAGYTFLGWHCDGALVNTNAYAYREDKTFVAEWKENVYNVTFESNGGSSVEGGEYLYSEMSQLIPVRDGYTFGGWFFDAGLTMTDADISDSNAVTAYAWWTEEDKPSLYLYEIDDQKAIILGYLSDSAVATIPTYIGGVKVAKIGDRAFENASGLQTVTFSNNVTEIGAYAFSGCVALMKINPIEVDGSVKNITLDGITAIGAYAFSGCSFTEIELPNTIQSLSNGIFENCKQLVTIRLGTINKVGEAAFAGCSSLSSILLTGTATTLGANAFRDCTSLTSVLLPSNLTTIGSGAFANCTSLSSLLLPMSITSIGDEAFMGCTALTTLANYTALTKLSSIGAYAFSGCEKLTTIGVPSSVKSIGDYAFENCLKLESVSLSSSITSIADGTFKGCSYLKMISVSSPLKSIGKEAFSGCRRLSGITLTESLISIGDYAFENCITISSLTFGSKITYMGQYAFKGCTRLSSASIPTGITVISEGLFDGCLALSKINWHNGITEIRARAFAGCQALSFDDFPSSCAIIEAEAFVGCQAIQSLSINQVLTMIGSRAFADCISLSKISFSGTNERWKGAVAEDAFDGCDDLKTIETVTWTFDDLRPWLSPNLSSNAFWAMDPTLSFNDQRPCAVLLFKQNNVFYKNLITVDENGAKVNDAYVWKLKISGATDIISSFSTTLTVTHFDVFDIGGYGYVTLDLGVGIAALQGIQYLDLNLEIVSKNDESKLLYSAKLGKANFEKVTTELTPDDNRTDTNKVSVSTDTENADVLFDSDLTTKYFSPSDNAIVMKGKEAFVLSSYSFITAQTQSCYPTTVPRGWTVWGGIELKDGTIEWVEVSRVDNGWMTADNLKEFHYQLNVDRAYHQYKIEFNSGDIVSLSEIVLYEKK